MTPEQRSRCMSKIKGKDTKPELLLRKALWKKGLRYRIHYKLPGRPDIAFVGKRLAIFVDGCFWHGCPEHGVSPKSRSEFWKKKLERNRERDKEVNEALAEDGWLVMRFWEHEIMDDLPSVVRKIARVYRKGM
ncbi:MAG: very short patch repair endonuclease [Sedimenticola sp.]